MGSERRILWFVRWLALLTILVAFVNTGLAFYFEMQGHWSLVNNRTPNILIFTTTMQKHGFLIMNAAAVWVLATIAEHLRGSGR